MPESKKLIKSAAQDEQKKEKADAKIASIPMFKDIGDLDKISAALPQVKGLGEISDNELDSLAKKATDAFDDLMDLGMNVDARFSGRVFEVASGMLKNAIDAKSAKIDKKLKMIELQIKKQAIDQKTNNTDKDVISGEGVVVSDRNSLLEKLKNMNK